MSFVELQNDFCENIQSHISKRMSNILYRNPFHVPTIELYVEFKQHMRLDGVGEEVNMDELGDIDWEEDNNDSEGEFEANYEVDDENNDGDKAVNLTVQNETDALVDQHPFSIPSFMQTLDLAGMHAPKFLEYVNMGEGKVVAKDGDFSVGMEFGSRESVIFAIKSYTISRGVDYITFYAKCKGYGVGCDWLIRASLIQKKGCWEIRRYNGKHMCTMGTIS
ncbi:hypothetical protein Ahy_B03g064649 isoform A [Arachis hypogaea]|uniref:Transposase MuDR plant domain-containing protein n=1 Tax=Arachis hypogaea TaxID=3818 RepID=A0A445A022_ARAHY|nr:hypothetical protein Ahy_B03g064649 isoform A [Arachis hypogaea]